MDGRPELITSYYLHEIHINLHKFLYRVAVTVGWYPGGASGSYAYKNKQKNILESTLFMRLYFKYDIIARVTINIRSTFTFQYCKFMYYLHVDRHYKIERENNNMLTGIPTFIYDLGWPKPLSYSNDINKNKLLCLYFTTNITLMSLLQETGATKCIKLNNSICHTVSLH